LSDIIYYQNLPAITNTIVRHYFLSELPYCQ